MYDLHNEHTHTVLLIYEEKNYTPNEWQNKKFHAATISCFVILPRIGVNTKNHVNIMY